MSTSMIASSNVTAPTQFLEVKNETYAYRRFGGGAAHPLVFLQHFTGTLDNWDPAVTDALAVGREVILFDNVGVGRSSGTVPETVQEMGRMRSLSWMRSGSNAWICLDFPWGAWSRKK